MKIEKVNENQIRCTLTKQDLADRQINLRELAYGSEKAKGLFHDMIQQANYEFGFDVSDNPLMVEAIPLSSESLVLLITKVEYPEELDTRFSQFTEAGDWNLKSVRRREKKSLLLVLWMGQCWNFPVRKRKKWPQEFFPTMKSIRSWLRRRTFW